MVYFCLKQSLLLFSVIFLFLINSLAPYQPISTAFFLPNQGIVCIVTPSKDISPKVEPIPFQLFETNLVFPIPHSAQVHQNINLPFLAVLYPLVEYIQFLSFVYTQYVIIFYLLIIFK